MFKLSNPMKVFLWFIIIMLIEPMYSTSVEAKKTPPHIILIVADDLGWNDVGFHGSSQIPTPNIDALAFSGIILNKYYVTPICTPSRAALMTGKYPIHTGMQHAVLYAAEPRGLPLNETLLPQHLKKLGYHNHIVGKWHLGHYKRVYTPLYRGFETHIGFWSGRIDYFDHTSIESQSWGLDIRRNMNVAYDLHGKYATHIIRDEAVNRIHLHNTSQPLFLYIAHSAVHSGNPYSPLPVPDDVVAHLPNITNYNRRKFAAITSELDDSVGHVVEALSKRNMLENSIIVFTTDNGGPAEGFNFNAASNWPLRGVKNTLWEGGVRGAGLIWSPLIKSSERVSKQVFHIVDWLPTLFSAAGGDIQNLGEIDGIDSWQALVDDKVTERKDILHNIDDIYGSAAVTVGDWKVIKGTNYNGTWDDWYGPAGERAENTYDVTGISNSLAGKSLAKLNMLPNKVKILEIRTQADIKCDSNIFNENNTLCEPLVSPCLFDIENDPCERHNLATKYPEILKTLLDKLEAFNKTAVPPGNLPSDPRADPKFWNNVWLNFGDYENSLGFSNRPSLYSIGISLKLSYL